MSKEKNQPVTRTTLFGKENYILMLAGLAILALGFFSDERRKEYRPECF